jgi:hypothetical protein
MAISSEPVQEVRRPPFFIGLIWVSLHLLSSCDFRERESEEEFRNFLDVNKDGEISRIEWLSYHQSQNIESGSYVLFEVTDCDSNGRLTWEEYRDGFVRAVAKCKYESPYRWLENRSRLFSYLPLLLEAETYAEIQRLDESWLNILASSTLTLPQNIYEMDLDGRGGGYVSMQCDQPSLQPTKIGVDPYNKDDIYNVSICSLTNNDKRFAVSVVLIEIALKTGSTYHIVKPLYVPPESTRQYRLVMPPNDSTEFDVAVLNARGMWPPATPNGAE